MPLKMVNASELVYAPTTMKSRLFILLLIEAFPQLSGAQSLAITSMVNQDLLTITASAEQYAGAIYSVRYRGKEYINTSDHGRELQSASSFDDLGECFNPTEAGSRSDGASASSSSRLVSFRAYDSVLETTSNMAFWLSPLEFYPKGCGARQAVFSAQNTEVQSNHILSKRVVVGASGIANIIRYTASFYVPEAHKKATFEVVTGYLPADFYRFLSYNPAKRILSSLTDGPGEQPAPVILSTADGRHAMGISSYGLPQSSFKEAGLGRFKFSDTNKWNCVYRESAIQPNTTFSYTCDIAIGTVDEVIAAQNALYPVQTRVEPIFRFLRDGEHFATRSYVEGVRNGYTFEGTSFHVLPSATDGLKGIYRCLDRSKHHFVSSDSACEGQIVESRYGYIYASPTPNTTALFSYFNPRTGDYLATSNPGELDGTSYQLLSILGYVPIQ